MIEERERNEMVLDELFGNHDFSDEVKDNLLIDWDKAFTCIFYNKKSAKLKEQGFTVYDNIVERHNEFLKGFKLQIEKMTK